MFAADSRGMGEGRQAVSELALLALGSVAENPFVLSISMVLVLLLAMLPLSCQKDSGHGNGLLQTGGSASTTS